MAHHRRVHRNRRPSSYWPANTREIQVCFGLPLLKMPSQSKSESRGETRELTSQGPTETRKMRWLSFGTRRLPVETSAIHEEGAASRRWTVDKSKIPKRISAALMHFMRAEFLGHFRGLFGPSRCGTESSNPPRAREQA
jgi:hypothetical protein